MKVVKPVFSKITKKARTIRKNINNYFEMDMEEARKMKPRLPRKIKFY